MKRTVIAVVVISLAILLIVDTSEAKKVREYLGSFTLSSYHASDNTPAGSYATSSGERAVENKTCAVDDRNPVAELGDTVYIQGFGKRRVNDKGHFGHFNNGTRAFDLFMFEGEGGLFFNRKVWLLRDETTAEKQARLKNERKRRQNDIFTLIYDEHLKEGEIITDKHYIKSGTVLIGYTFLEVVGHRHGLANRILIGVPLLDGLQVKLSAVFEEVVG